jgi:hypothetical protein
MMSEKKKVIEKKKQWVKFFIFYCQQNLLDIQTLKGGFLSLKKLISFEI